MSLFSRFTDTIFLKNDSSLQKRYDALVKLVEEFPDNKELKDEFFITKKGLIGENEIIYQLKKANLGLYVLRDINIEYEDLKAQIDFIVVTPMYCYFIECKNLNGNITVNENGDFIREYEYNGQENKVGMYSPLRQVEAQRDVYKKIWNTRLSKNDFWNNVKRILSERNFKNIHRVLVVAANNETILNMKYAPKEVKKYVIKSDSLVRRITDDLNNSVKDLWDNQKNQELWASSFLNINKEINVNYYEYYMRKFDLAKAVISDEDLKQRLIEFRKIRSQKMNIPAYYICTNEELDRLVELKPVTLEELKKLDILSSIRMEMHGENIIEEIRKYI